MSTPRFTADASLYTTSRTYQGAVSPVRSGAIIQPALDFACSFFNRCGCFYAYLDCIYGCSQPDGGPICDLNGDCPCLDICWTSYVNCAANSAHQLLSLPRSVVGPLGR
jgi:hypothetical protein